MKEIWKQERQPLLDRECTAYFRKRPVFDRLLQGFREKYTSYGFFGGTVVLRNLTQQEIEDLEGFFERNYHGQKSVSISAARFEKALKDSRFGCLAPKKVLELYFREKMAGKKEQRERESEQGEKLFAEVKAQYAATPAEEWLTGLPQSNMKPYLVKRYREMGGRIEDAARILRLGAQIVNQFPFLQERTEYLAVFAAMVTGNPHAFDDGTRDGQLLYWLVQWAAERQGLCIEQSRLFPALQKQRYYLAAGILRDDISNYVTLCGIRVWKKDGELHEGMEGFLKEREMVQVPLSVITGWERITCPDQMIYIVENPSVYAMLCEKWRGERACMCMNGQPRLSALLILDLLADAGVKVLYAGDFDPEGLLIAQKIGQYYRAGFSYWHMSKEDYAAGRSEEKISSRRIKMLDRIVDPELRETAEAVKKAGVAGFQENIWNLYLEK